MGFFGISSNSRPGKVISDDLYVYDRVKDVGDYYIFLVEGKLDALTEKRLVSDIEAAGYSSYIILSAMNGEYVADDISGSKTEFSLKNKSRWSRYINYKDKHVRAIMAFGDSLLQINKSDDCLTNDFMAEFVRSYYYLGHGFIGDYDCHIFPVHSLSMIYHHSKNDPTKIDLNYLTQWFREQLTRMLKPNYWTPDLSPYRIHKLETTDEVRELLKSHNGAEYCSFDLETTGLSWRHDNIVCLTICWDINDGYFIPWKLIQEMGQEGIDLLAEHFRSVKHLIGCNPKFDIKFLWQNGLPRDILPTDDTMLLCHAIHSDRSKGLKPSAFYFTYFGGYEEPLKTFRKQTGIDNYGEIPSDILDQYATLDVIVALRVYFEAYKLLDELETSVINDDDYDKLYDDEGNRDKWTIRRWYEQMMMGIYPAICEAEYIGVRIDVNVLDKKRKMMIEELKKAREECAKAFNTDPLFDWFSTQKLVKLLQDNGYPQVGDSFKTDDDAIIEWQRLGLKGVNELVNLRAIWSCLNTFMGLNSEHRKEAQVKDKDPTKKTGWLEYLDYHPEDNSWRMHQLYNIMGVVSFRCSSTNPNMQNIPTRGKWAPEVKRCFTTPTCRFYDIEDDATGQTWHLKYDDKVETQRGIIRAEELTENDTIKRKVAVRKPA